MQKIEIFCALYKENAQYPVFGNEPTARARIQVVKYYLDPYGEKLPRLQPRVCLSP